MTPLNAHGDRCRDIDPPEDTCRECGQQPDDCQCPEEELLTAGNPNTEGNKSSWELDAIEPSEPASIVRSAIILNRNSVLWHSELKREESFKSDLQHMADNYNNNE